MRSKTWRRSALRLAACEGLESRRMLAANLVISEFLASNSTGLKDSFGNRDDWIELHNTGDAAANLNDYYLTDDASNLEKYRLPTQTLAAGAYVVVFADNLNEVTAAGEIHTNFALAASGEYLGLINAADDSVAFEYAPTYPAQSADISYGLFDANDPNSARTYFNTPTPGAANTPTAQPVGFSVAGKTFTGTLNVVLSDNTPNASIYYTTNGTSPTSSSTLYTSGLSLTNTTMLRAIAYVSGLGSSLVTSQSYTALNTTTSTTATLGSSTLNSFSSNLPIVMINTYGQTIGQTTDIPTSMDYIDTTNGTASILGTPNYDGRAGIHIRGSTSSSYPKQQYAVELWDENNNGKSASLLGMPAESDWVLYAPYTELAMMQNALAYQWANETGHYASRTRYVEVFMNTSAVTTGGTASPTSGADYLGVYILEEKVKANSNRVDVGAEVSDTNPNGGFILNQDRTTGESYFTTSQYGVKLVNADPNQNHVDATIESSISTAWDAFENALVQPDFDDPNSANYYGKFINVSSFVDYYIVNEMTRNIDAFWLSTYYNKTADTVVNGTVTQRGLISAGPVWDFNLSLGAPNYNDGENPIGWDTNTLTPAPGAAGVTGFNPQDPYFQRLLTDPNFKQAIADRWEQLRSTVFSTSQLMSDIDANVSILADGTTNYPVGYAPTQPATNPIVRNFIRWQELAVTVTTVGPFDPNGSWIQDVDLVKNWLTARVNWIDSQFIPAPTLTPGGQYSGPTAVTMTGIGGATITDTTLIGPNSSVFYTVPSADISDWVNLSATTLPSGWSQGTTGLGYDTTTTGTGAISFLPYISTNLQSQMLGKHSTVYTLLNFNISNPSQIQDLVLKAYYDDGFIAWVNGVRVMDANSPEDTQGPGYRTVAGSSGDDSLAITDREFDLSAIKNYLVAGNNTLAIMGLNSGSGSEDFLLDPTLYARTYTYANAGTVYYTTDGSDPRNTDGTVSSTAVAYTTALTLSASTRIQARTLVNGVWSALSTQVYAFGDSPLRITELQYDPPDDQNYEFIKVENTGSLPLNLSGYQLTDGVTFTFPDTFLAAGASAVIVHDLTSFTARYGTQFNVLGAYSGSLKNTGESVAFTDAFGTTVQSFTYSPTWYPETNGGGYSLVVKDPLQDKSLWGTAAGWMSSLADSPPVAQSSSVGTGTSFNVSVQFAQSLGSTLNLAGLVLTNTTTGTTIPLANVTSAISGNDLILTFPGYLYGELPNGNYSATLPVGAVTTASGVPLGASYNFNFFTLLGDANHDGKVDIADLGILATDYGQSGMTFAQGDFNFDGKVDIADLGILATNYGVSLPGSGSVAQALVDSGVSSPPLDKRDHRV